MFLNTQTACFNYSPEVSSPADPVRLPRNSNNSDSINNNNNNDNIINMAYVLVSWLPSQWPVSWLLRGEVARNEDFAENCPLVDII